MIMSIRVSGKITEELFNFIVSEYGGIYMINYEHSLIAKGKLIAYLDDRAVLEPPCFQNIIYEIFVSYNHTGYSKNRETPLEKLQGDFPYIPEKDLLKLIEYLEAAKDYCETVCCAFAGIYQSVSIPNTIEAQQDVQLVIKACLKRYPWIKPEFVEGMLPGICWLCNR